MARPLSHGLEGFPRRAGGHWNARRRDGGVRVRPDHDAAGRPARSNDGRRGLWLYPWGGTALREMLGLVDDTWGSPLGVVPRVAMIG